MGIISIFSFWPFLWASFLIFSFKHILYLFRFALFGLHLVNNDNKARLLLRISMGSNLLEIRRCVHSEWKKKWNKDYWCLGCQNEMLGRWDTIVLTPSFSLLPCMSASQCDKYISVLLPPQVNCSCFYHYTAKIHFIRSTLLTLCWISFCIQNCFNSS